jgi:hypothetical protein
VRLRLTAHERLFEVHGLEGRVDLDLFGGLELDLLLFLVVLFLVFHRW